MLKIEDIIVGDWYEVMIGNSIHEIVKAQVRRVSILPYHYQPIIEVQYGTSMHMSAPVMLYRIRNKCKDPRWIQRAIKFTKGLLR